MDDHLWVVLSDPDKNPDQVVIVSLTTHTAQKEQVCIIQKEEFPEVLTHTTCVSFKHTQSITVEQFKRFLEANLIEIRPSLSATLLDKIRQSAADSVDIKDKFADILIEQGLLDLEG